MVISIIIWRFYIWPLDGPKGSCTNPLLQLWSDLYRCTVHLTTLRCSPATYWFGVCALCHKDAIKCLWLFYMIFFSCSINHWRRVLRCQYYSTNSARNCVKTGFFTFISTLQCFSPVFSFFFLYDPWICDVVQTCLFFSTEFDKFLAERAKAAERLPSLRSSSQDISHSES